jgi:hypothetical protein
MKDLTVLAKIFQSLGSMVKNKIKFIEDEGIRWSNLRLVYDNFSRAAPSNIESDFPFRR